MPAKSIFVYVGFLLVGGFHRFCMGAVQPDASFGTSLSADPSKRTRLPKPKGVCAQ